MAKREKGTNGNTPTPTLEVALSTPLEGLMEQPLGMMPSVEGVYTAIEKTIRRAVKQGDPQPALDMLHGLVEVQQVSGLGLSKALFLIKKNWDNFEVEETFEDAVFRVTGKSADLVRRYVQIQQLYEDMGESVEPDTIEILQSRPMKDQAAIAQFAAAHGMPNKKQIESLAKAPDGLALRDKLAKIKAKSEGASEEEAEEAVSNAFVLTVKRDGKVYARQGKNKELVATITVDMSDEDNPLVARFLAKLQAAGFKFD